MKFSYAGALVALTLASLLTACGGKAQYTVQGSISGLTVDGLELTNGGETITLNRGATSFAFSNQIDYGASFDITVKSPPFMTCGVSGGTGTAGYTVAIGAAVSCSPTAYSVGGHYTGLTSTTTTTQDSDGKDVVTTVVRSAVLINGSATPVTVSSTSTSVDDGEFSAATLTNGDVYSISILTQPTGLFCTLGNNVGVVRGANVTNMTLTCAPATATASN
jgi:hypothetical protein